MINNFESIKQVITLTIAGRTDKNKRNFITPVPFIKPLRTALLRHLCLPTLNNRPLPRTLCDLTTTPKMNMSTCKEKYYPALTMAPLSYKEEIFLKIPSGVAVTRQGNC